MRQRLWMTAVALAAPTISLFVGLSTTFAAVHAANELSEHGRREQLEHSLEATAAQLSARMEHLPGGGAWPGAAGPPPGVLLEGLGAGPDTALGLGRDGEILGHNAGQARLTALGTSPVPGHEGLDLIALGPSTYFADPLPVVVAGIGVTSTVLVSVSVGVWSLQGKRRRAVEQDLARTVKASRHDPLTGLANRPHLMERLDAQLASAKQGGPSVGLIFIDVDRFKAVNDTMGHATGDELLKEVARRLSASVRGGDLVARLAGDEFVVVFPAVTDAERLSELAERCQAAFATPVELGTGPFYASLSMGLAVGDSSTASSHALLEQADAAMYVCKATPGVNHAFFDETLRAEADGRQVLADALRAGLQADELTLHYQPVVAVRSGETVAVEAFVRWHRPGHGVVAPAAFLPVAEDNGLIVAIGRMVLHEACRQAAAWNAAPDMAPMPVAVNVSERQLLAPDFVAVVSRAIAESGVRAELLHLEVDEAVAADKRVRASGVFERLERLGVGLVIDDFGLRHGSLGLLKGLKLAAVKIHGSTVTDVADDERDQAMVEAVVNLAGVLDTMVVAESVETPAQLATLRRLGVANVQGHLLMAPAPAEALDAMHRTRTLPLDPSLGLARVAALGPARR